MTTLLTLGILFSTVGREVVVAKLVILGILPLTTLILALSGVVAVKLVILGILFLTSFILALRLVLVAKLIISSISSSIFLILALYRSFLTTLFFTKSLILLKSTGTGNNLSRSVLYTLLFELLRPVDKFYNLSISNLFTSNF